MEDSEIEFGIFDVDERFANLFDRWHTARSLAAHAATSAKDAAGNPGGRAANCHETALGWVEFRGEERKSQSDVDVGALHRASAAQHRACSRRSAAPRKQLHWNRAYSAWDYLRGRKPGRQSPRVPWRQPFEGPSRGRSHRRPGRTDRAAGDGVYPAGEASDRARV